MSRIAAVWNDAPARLVSALAVLMLAALLAVASGASFTSSSANPANTFTAGNLSHANDKDGSAILTAAKMKPGDTQSGTVTITNDGDLDGVFSLSTSGLSDTPAAPAFSDKLDLVITDQTTSTEVYDGKLGAVPAGVALGTFAPGDAHTYEFVVTFPDGGPGADNAYKGASTSIDFDWVSTETP
jgi:spore coat-associated protein N